MMLAPYSPRGTNRAPSPTEQPATVGAPDFSVCPGGRSHVVRRTSPEIIIILVYILISRLSLGHEAQYGIQIGSAPIFPTDVALVLLAILTARRHRAWFRRWIFTGKGATPVGRAVWCICVLSVIYFILAFPAYHLFALRDLAVFGYGAFFPLAYVVIRDRKTAVRVTHYLVYGSLIIGLPVAIEFLTGWNLGIRLEQTKLMTTFGLFPRIAVGDLGSNLGFSLAAVVAYLMLRSGNRLLNIATAVVSIVVIAAQLTRSGVICAGAAVILTILFARKRRRVAVLVLAAVAALVFVAHSSLLGNLAEAAKSGTAISNDVDFDFRLLRWASALSVWMGHPVLGAGFGVQLALPDPAETGMFNSGMPHNSYLTILARVGLVGLGLFLFAAGRPLYLLLRKIIRKGLDPELLAVANLLVAMALFAFLNLFLEEPLLIAPFWIMLAVACRLIESAGPRLVVRPRGRVAVRGPEAHA